MNGAEKLAMLVLIVAAAVGAFLVLVGTGSRPDAPVIFIDKSTGCEYIATPSGNSITPRRHAGGKQICRPPSKD